MTSHASNRMILLGALDRTPASDWVSRTISSLGSTLPGAEVHLLHVTDARGAVESAAAAEERLHEASAFIERASMQVAESIGARVAAHVAAGAAKAYILQLASDLMADLIVVGSHRKSAPGRWLLGSVSQAVMHEASCAVLIARPKEYAPGPEIEPACPKCLEVQQASAGATLWCAAHSTRHVRAHVHHARDIGSLGGTSTLIRT